MSRLKEWYIEQMKGKTKEEFVDQIITDGAKDLRPEWIPEWVYIGSTENEFLISDVDNPEECITLLPKDK